MCTDVDGCREAWGEHGCVVAIDEGLLLAQGRRDLEAG